MILSRRKTIDEEFLLLFSREYSKWILLIKPEMSRVVEMSLSLVERCFKFIEIINRPNTFCFLHILEGE